MKDLEKIINDAFDNRDSVSLSTTGPIRDSVNSTLEKLDSGSLRVCEKIDGEWIVNQWTKRSSTIGRNVSIITGNGRINGKAVKIDDDGALIISKGKKIEKILVGDITHDQ